MGQRSQIYIRETVGNTVNLVARYYGWNFGSRMVSRCRYTLEWLQDAIWENPFNGVHGPILNIPSMKSKLERIMDTNFDFKNVVLGQDIIDEYYEQYPEENFNNAVFCRQDNNDGKLIIDIKDGVFKYAFLDSAADSNNIMSAEQYMVWDHSHYENWKEAEYLLKNGEVAFCEANFPEIEKLATLMTKEEVEEFLSFDYKGVIPKPEKTLEREKHQAALRNLILEINNSKKEFESVDIDNSVFIEFICNKMNIQEWKYREIMGDLLAEE